MTTILKITFKIHRVDQFYFGQKKKNVQRSPRFNRQILKIQCILITSIVAIKKKKKNNVVTFLGFIKSVAPLMTLHQTIIKYLIIYIQYHIIMKPVLTFH